MLQLLIKRKFPHIRQLDAMDCGPTCLKMIGAWYGKDLALSRLRECCAITKQGVSITGLTMAAEQMGFKTLAAQLSIDVLLQKKPLPAVLHWDHKHFVVLYDMDPKKARISDPAVGNTTYSLQDLLQHWQIPGKSGFGNVLLLEPTAALNAFPAVKTSSLLLAHFWQYVRAYRKTLLFIVLTLLGGSLFTLLLPFLTQAIVDKALRFRSVSLLELIVAGQCVLFLGRIVMEVMRARLIFYLGTHINISMLGSFLAKLMRLPMDFFDTRNIGDSLQRMMDHHKIEEFLTSSVINMLMAVVSILTFGIVLFYYHQLIFWIFMAGSIAALAWSLSWMPRRKLLDYHTFRRASESQNVLIESMNAIQEIKLTASEEQKLQQWRSLQESLYETKLQSLKLDQRLLNGTLILNELKNIAITYVAARYVMSGDLSTGAMLSIMYITGQLNMPVLQFAEFIRSSQNAAFSLKRMQEVHSEKAEDENIPLLPGFHPDHCDVVLNNISFRYGNAMAPMVLQDINVTIPAGKTTAIVGVSGSGKTTLLKLLLKFFQPVKGEIYIGDDHLQQINAAQWRKYCGVVMQDGFIFSDTIANNICAGNVINREALRHAAKMANIDSFIEGLPLQYDTKIGKDGHGLSEGQVQRILIARLIYRKPSFILMDEATNSLDANNEKVILENLQQFFRGKTVVVVAHRLSTVKNANQIIVLDKGRIIEQGTHQELISRRGAYLQLVHNQLELGV